MMLTKPKTSVSEEAFSSFSTCDPSQETAVSQFYEQFGRQQLFESLGIANVVVRNGPMLTPYAVYIVQVRTRLIDFTVEKRYSSFRQLWKRMSERASLTCQFPPKTFLSSSAILPETITLRQQQLDMFLKQLSCLPRELLPELYEFLGIRNVYNREKVVLETSEHEPQAVKTTEQGVLDLLVRMDFDPAETLSEIERLIFQHHTRISSQTIRQLFAGLGNRKGLLQIALAEDAADEIIRSKALRLANRLLSYEENRDADSYYRAFASCPLKMFKAPAGCLVESSQLRVNLFRLLRIYLRICHDHADSLQSVFGEPKLEQQFKQWSKFQSDQHSLHR